jgi:hypothetical protein
MSDVAQCHDINVLHDESCVLHDDADNAVVCRASIEDEMKRARFVEESVCFDPVLIFYFQYSHHNHQMLHFLFSWLTWIPFSSRGPTII